MSGSTKTQYHQFRFAGHALALADQISAIDKTSILFLIKKFIPDWLLFVFASKPKKGSVWSHALVVYHTIP